MGKGKGERPDPLDAFLAETHGGLGGKRIPSRGDWEYQSRFPLGPRRQVQERPNWFVVLSIAVFFGLIFGFLALFTWHRPEFPMLVVIAIAILAVLVAAALSISAPE